MPPVQKTKLVEAGSWRTLEKFWNSPRVDGVFRAPAGTRIKVRYGDGWPFGWNSQSQTLDGEHDKTLTISKASVVYARMQARVSRDTELTYTLFFPGP